MVSISKTSLRRLVRKTSVVLMDLRSFSAKNKGCIYEPGQTLNNIDQGRAVFAIDST
jgi:hypothetical protein